MSEKTFDERFIELLKAHNDFVDDNTGELLRERIKRRAYDLDKDLITLLLSDDTVAAVFFEEIAGRWIFNNNKFVAYLNDTNFLDKSYTKFKNKIGLNVDGKYLQERGEVALVWPYKDCVLEGGQTKEQQKQTEIFFNEILAPDEINQMFEPKVLTNWKRNTVDSEQDVTEIQRDENGAIRENFIIKGNNLITLHTLKKQFRGKVKLIYIDPPYNPDNPSNNTFMYNNNFNRSSWLTFMKNRLEVAKELLTNDGVMIVAIDKNEQVYLGVLLDEVFPAHEKHCITIIHNPRGVQGENFSYTHEYAFFVIPKDKKVIGDREIPPEEITWDHLRNWGTESKREDAKNCFYPVIVEDGEIVGFGDVLDDDEHPLDQTVQHGKKYLVYPIDQKGVERKWRYARQSVDGIKHLLRAKEVERGYEIELGKDFGMYRTVWEDKRYDANVHGTQLVKKLVPGCKFDFPKSLWNVYDCLRAVIENDKEAVILDFFGGSGTTAHAVLELNKDGGNRKFIICEQMHYVETVTRKRVKKVIEQNNCDDFIYCELKAYNEAFMERIQSAESTEQLLEIWREMPRKSILNWYINPKAPEKAEEEFIKIDDLNQQKQELAKQLNKNQLYVNLSEIADETYEVSESDKQLNTDFYANKGDDDE